MSNFKLTKSQVLIGCILFLAMLLIHGAWTYGTSYQLNDRYRTKLDFEEKEEVIKESRRKNLYNKRLFIKELERVLVLEQRKEKSEVQFLKSTLLLILVKSICDPLRVLSPISNGYSTKVQMENMLKKERSFPSLMANG